jgi:ribonucleoside-diphosphate reductase alpha chain
MNELPSVYQTVIAKSRYARYLSEEHRRESWVETVDRYINFMYKTVKENPNVSEEDKKHIYEVLGATCEL